MFGCPAYIHVNDDKLEPRARKCVFVGYRLGVKGYRVWCEKSKKVITSRDVVFDESCMITPEKEFSICNDVGSSHDTEENVELESISHDDDAPTQDRHVEGSPQTQRKTLLVRDKEGKSSLLKDMLRSVTMCNMLSLWQMR